MAGPLCAEPNSWLISPSGYTAASTYDFLPDLLQGVQVVALGESIHMTHEFPLVRIGIVRQLNQSLGFGTLAFEGSPVDLWSTQDRFLASHRTAADANAAMGGLFRIWNDSEIAQLFGYEAQSWATNHPLYITAWDVQPGNGWGVQGTEAFRLLSRQLLTYSAPPPGLDLATWLAEIDRTRCLAGVTPQDAQANHAIDQLAQWIDLAAPAVQQRYPHLPHTAALRLIPGSLRGTLALCQDSSSINWSRYGTIRMMQASNLTLQLQQALPNGKLILWGQSYHLSYTPGQLGYLLRQKLGPSLYTLSLFSDGGSAFVVFSNPKDDVGYARIHPAQDALRAWLDTHPQNQDVFADLRRHPAPVFAQPVNFQFENFHVHLPLPQLFDAALWIRHTHPPQYPLIYRLILAIWHVHYQVGAAVLLLLLCALLLVWSRLRKRRHSKRLKNVRAL